jgi:two-component system, NarL family, sensor histidine kinase BarA
LSKQRPSAPWRVLKQSNRLQIRQSSRKLKRSIALFASIFAVGTIVLLSSVIAEQRQSAEERAWNDTYNLSGAFEEQVHRVIDSIRGAMSLIKLRLAAEGAGFDLGGWLARAPEFAASTAQVAFVGADGRLVSTSLDQNPAAIDLSDREHVRFHLKGGKGLFIGKPVIGRVSGKWTIQVSDRVESPDGKFVGVVVFSISPDFLTTLHRAVRLGQGGSMILAGTDGVIRASFAGFQKSGEEFTGASISGMGALKESTSAESGAFVENSPLDSKPAFFSWRKVSGYPLIVIVGLAEAEIFAVPNRSAAMLATLGGAMLTLTLTVTLILYREIALRVQREIALFDESRKAVRANENLKRRHEQLLKTSAELNAERARLQRVNRELAHAKKLAVQASQAKTSMLMNMSHEFRTPMHAILNYTSMGLKKIESNDWEKLKKHLTNINSSGVRLLGMLNALLDLAKLESGKFDLRLERQDLAQIIRQSQSEVDSLFEAKQLNLTFETSAASTIAILDKQQMLQVFINLFSNAVKFAPAQSAVKVRIEACMLAGNEPALHCSVGDEGPGIPEGELEVIFDKFTQSSKTNGAGGSGLGLAICREIVHLHRGKIWASNTPGSGAVIHIMLPTRLASSNADAAPQRVSLNLSANVNL